MKESTFDLYINDLLKEADIQAGYQGSSIKEISDALSSASKSQTGEKGAPDFIAVVKDFVIVIEDKADKNKLCLRDDDGKISLKINATKDYALNGALFYSKKILGGSSFKKIFAFGCAGEPKHHILKPLFVSENKIIELSEIETFENFSPENIESYYKKVILKEELPEEIENENIGKIAENLHEDLRNYGNLGAHENPLVVAAILLALSEQKHGFKLEQLNGDEVETDGEKLYKALQTSLSRAKVADQVKKEQIMTQFNFIKNTPILNRINPSLAKTPLKYFTEFINRHVYSKLNIESSGEDYIGRFYMEFIRYTGGDGQSLGIVITPKHITELFCDLVDLKPDDVIFDPCCGTGGFLIAGMHRMLRTAKNESEKSRIKKNQIFGIELRPDMFSMATTSMILHGDGRSNLICDDFFSFNPSDLQLNGITVGFMNPPYSQAKNKETSNLSELAFIENLLDSVLKGGRVAVIVPVSTMTGKNKEDKFKKAEILKHHTLEGVISLNKSTFYPVGTVPCIAVFTAGEPHQPEKISKFINFEDDGWEVKMHIGLVETERAKDRKQYLLDCWQGKIKDCPSNFMVETHAEASDEWLHSFYYYNDELPGEDDFKRSIADYLTFEFNMIAHGRGYLFNYENEQQNEKKNLTLDGRHWGKFAIGDLFSISSGKRLRKEDMTAGDKPFIGASDSNNGITEFVSNTNVSEDSNVLGVNYNGSIVENFYHPYECLFSDDVKRFKLKTYEGNKYVYLFLKQAILTQKNKYTYGYKFNETRMKRQIIQLPVDASGQPDYKFMENYVRQCEQKMLQDYFDFISPRLKNFTTKKKMNLDGWHWEKFNLNEIFEIHATVNGIDKNKLNVSSGVYPYITRSDINNGLSDFVCKQKNYKLNDGNCIVVGLDTQTAFYQPEKFYTGQNIQILRNKKLNAYNAKFFLPVLKKTLSIFSWGGNGATLTRLRRSKIFLPVDDSGQPDYKFMEDYIKNLEHDILKQYIDIKLSS